MGKKTAVQDRMTKSEILNEIADNTGLTRKEVSSVFDELECLIERHIRKRGCGFFVLPGLLKIKAVKRPARKAQKNVPNPFSPGSFMNIAARPASMKVKINSLKKLKEMVL